MRVTIELDVPEWQIGKHVEVFFPDTMMKKGVCELLKEQEAVKPTWQQGKAYCGSCGKRIPLKIGARYCHKCGKAVKWNE